MREMIFIKKQRKKIWYDVTSYCENREHKNGVNRVVANVLNNLRIVADEYEVVCISGFSGKYRVVDSNTFNYRKEKVEPIEGDIYLSVDLNPVQPYVLWKEIEKWQKRGCKIVGCVYDLVYITYPEYVSDNNAVFLLERWLCHAVSHYDGLVCISKTVNDELLDFAKNRGIDCPQLLTDYFHLGGDFDHEGNDSETTTALLSKVRNNKTIYIAVSTIEPRKGYDILVEGFERAYNKGAHNSILIIVGREGWKSEDYVKQIKNSKRYNHTIFWYKNCDDAVLDMLYRVSDYYISASHYEGFNLGIVEASQRGLPCILSDISIHHEVSGEKALYFSDPEELANIILEKNEGETNIVDSPIPYLSWRESTEMLWKAVKKVARVEQ